MTEDALELEILKRFVAQHGAAERSDPNRGDKCLRELNLKHALAELTGKAGEDLEHLVRIWFARLAPSQPRSDGPPALLRRCSDTRKKDGEHRYHARAYLDDSAGIAPAWDRLRELERDRELSGAAQVRPMSSGIKLFISHSSADAELAGRIIDLLRAALNLPAVSIRCTSVDGYRLPGGADTNEQLRREVHDAAGFIGIVSAGSLRSLYVLFELGARWGANKHLIPLLSPGTNPAVLGGPLAGLNALRADSRAQLHQLVTDLGDALAITPDGPAAYEKHISDIVAIKPTVSDESTTAAAIAAPLGPSPQISVVPYEGSEAILFLQNSGGDAILMGEAQIVEVDSGAIGHPAPYRMLWRDTSTHEMVKGHEYRIVSGGRVKLLLAKWQSGGDWGKPSMVIIGNRSVVDQYHHDPWERRSQSVTIEVTIVAVPPLHPPFKRRYSLYVPPKTLSKIAIAECE